MTDRDSPLISQVFKLFIKSEMPLDDAQAESMATYLTLLQSWSVRINLTGFRDPMSAAERLLYDATEVAPLIPEGAKVLDVGAGAGGLAAALTIMRPDLSFRLCEPRQKRATFLRKIRREMAFDRWEIAQDRAENLRGELSDATYAQAVMPPKKWLPLAATLVREGGVVICLTATPLDDDIPAEPLRLETRRSYRLPRSGAQREATLFRLPEAATISTS